MIRHFEPKDADQVIELWKKTDLYYGPIDTKKNILRKHENEPDLFLVEEIDGKVTGTVIGQYDCWWASIFHLAVDPDHQSRGIGRRLMESMERILKEKGADNIVIFRGKDTSNDTFYKKIGYEKVYDLESWIKKLK